MDLDSELELIHQPTRLRIMRILYRHRDVSYSRLRDVLDLTDGNLAAHTETLETADCLESRKAWAQNGFETRYRITKHGVSTFKAYLAELRQLLEEVPDEK
ncbi:transcriptional regulator [Halocatena halophila]|uniref:transcriptional regulator n=1 Tax=Halocatena halophila TaxID=2814576 RepID=UPI002ED6A710